MNETYSKKLSDIKFDDFKKYLNDNDCFGFTVIRRKRTIIYTFKRLYNGIRLSLKVMVNRHTKNVISLINEDKVYIKLEDIKKLVDRK